MATSVEVGVAVLFNTREEMEGVKEGFENGDESDEDHKEPGAGQVLKLQHSIDD